MVTDYNVNPYRYMYDKYTYVQYIVIYSIRVFFSTLFLSSLNAMCSAFSHIEHLLMCLFTESKEVIHV